ncbi:ATP-binding protein, partial [Streptomyces sp. Act-28]
MATAGEQRRREAPPLLERDSELLTIERALDDVCGTHSAGGHTSRQGGVIGFAGPAGLGKTTLLAHLRRSATDRGCTVLSARGGEQERQVPFHVMRQLVQPVFAAMPEGERREILGDWYDIVAPATGLSAPRPGASPDPQGVRDGLDWVITNLSVRGGPVVLVIDDVHWVDRESLAWLIAFAARAGELGMLIAVACRPDELPTDALPLHNLVARNRSHAHELAPLTAAAVSRIVRTALGEHADESFCRECWAITGGNPFEVVELTAKGGDRGLVPREENIPQLRALASAVKGSGLVERLEQLGPSAVRLAWAAAVVGNGVPTGVVGAVAALGDAQLDDAVARLETARILTTLPNLKRERVVEFSHPLIATAVYRSIPHGVRVGMHGVAAQALVDEGHGATAAARHMLEMHPEGDPWVVRQLRRAARDSFSAGAPEAARRYLARALREPPDVEDRAQVLFELGSANLPHEPATAVNQLRAALEEPKIGQDLREVVTYRLAQALVHTGRMEQATELLTEEARRTTSARTRLRMQAQQFKWNAVNGAEHDSRGRSRLLTQFAKRLAGRDLAERHILGLRAWHVVLHGEPVARSLRYAEQALRGGMSWTDQDFGFEVPAVVALTLMYCDQPGRAEELFHDGIAEFETKGWRGAHLSFAYTLLGYVRFRRGRLAEAEDFVRSGLRIADRVGQGVPAQLYAVGALVETLLARGRTDEARRVADEYRFGEDVPGTVVYPDPQAVRGKLLLARGRIDEAIQQLTAAGERLKQRGTRNPAWSPWQLDLSLALADRRPEEARHHADEAVSRAREFGTASAVGQALRVAAAVSEPARAVPLLAEAVDHLEQSPAAYELAHALVDHGTALRSVGDLDRAALIVTAGGAVAAAGQVTLGRSRMREVSPKPERTIETLKE